ncbi:biotin synthase BioB [Clostridioides difficile]|uniref:biotin synthase BioB n=1 Tax=Clostridioides difficile TaxID=1496 RepID=UPI000872B8C1|nr:biotin synthase BioB [Clostridioides difficile]AXU63089.1 biotin synthase [Clostridioides difficile]EGT4035084.1 biotin synthase BioB [Clostridioides difficile]EGT5089260.1 biotin synthase BioB [Clostridioides difficile]EGT5493774.1 biotin synthase BioB [Clostridioides difficile]EJX3385877.1 biotin synthase BioB [Clostridioides difficile]
MEKYTIKLKNKVLRGKEISYEEALNLISLDTNNKNDFDTLLKSANEIREYFMGRKADLCTIMNAKSGKCSEDCKFCAQSFHYKTGVEEYSLLDYNEILNRAKEMESKGVHRFSLVTSGKGMSGKEFNDILNIYEGLRKNTNLKLCASLGIIDYEKAKMLKSAGVTTYHHNVETCRDNFHNICTTHTYKDRIKTIKDAKKAGLDVCVGGIIGMNESEEQRLKMAFEIRELNVKSFPINILNPIKNTPMENYDVLEPMEILKTTAVFRFIIPNVYIRYAGGRLSLKGYDKVGFNGGVNSAIVGDYLTTVGSGIENDKKMIIEQGFELY